MYTCTQYSTKRRIRTLIYRIQEHSAIQNVFYKISRTLHICVITYNKDRYRNMNEDKDEQFSFVQEC